MCGYTRRTNTWSQRTTACEECLTPEVQLNEDEVPTPNRHHDVACGDCHTPEGEGKVHSYKSNSFDSPFSARTFSTVSSKNTTTLNGKPVNSKSVLIPITVIFGWSGIHRLITGKYVSGFLYMFTFGLHGIGWIYDIILVLTGKFKDKNGIPIGKGKA